MGSREDPIRTARELVMENRINDAILLLEQTVRDDPERIDEAESLLKAIREIRGEYNFLFEQLIDNLVNNPDDIETTLGLIAQMEALDEYPNERVVQQVDDAKVVAQLAYDRSLVEKTMDQALQLIAGKKYVDAMDLYLTLNDLQRSVFENRGFGDIFRNSVDQQVAQANAASELFVRELPNHTKSSSLLANAVAQAGQIPEAAEIQTFVEDELLASDIVGQTTDAANALSILRTQVGLQFPDSPVDWYLNFRDTVLKGRQDHRDDEGIVYVQKEAFSENTNAVYLALSTRIARELNDASIEIGAGQYASAVDIYTVIERLTQIEQTIRLTEYGFSSEANLAEALGGSPTPEFGQNLLLARSREYSAESRAILYERLATVQGNSVGRADTLFTLRSRQDAVLSVYAQMARDFSAWQERLVSLEPFEPLPGEGTRIVEATTRAWTERLTEVASAAANLTVQIAQRRREDLSATLDSEEAVLTESERLLDGIEIENPDATGDDTVLRVSRYPDDVLTKLEQVGSVLGEVRDDFGSVQTDFVSLPPAIQELDQYKVEKDEVDRLGERLVSVEAQIDSTRAAAEDLIRQSDSLRSTGDDRVQDARAAISSLLVSTAKDNWDAAREAYYASLELREDEDFRRQVDALILSLGEDIQEAENVIVVRRVRELLVEAQGLYNRDEYAGARDVLLQATQLWEQTNVDSNAEIDRLLRLVTAALNLEEGRELTVTDPLYPILGNYLSLAKEDYATGARLLENGDETGADRFFDRSLENLRNVRDVRPLNWEARILELRIAQIRSDTDFDAVFESRYNQALSRLDESGPIAVYAELEVLAEINPDYPGLQQQLVSLEIQLNLREDPVDQARINQATALVSRAEDLVNVGGRDEIQVAVSLLEQAVTINPGDSDAQFLLDDLRIQLGGQAQVALSSSDDQQYRRAETLFSQGRVLQALSIVEQLLRNPTNQNYPPLVDLRRRISVRLGI